MKAFGNDRVRVTPISETAEIGMAVGAAFAGYRPVVQLYMAEFMLVAMDQVVNEAPRFYGMTAGQVKVPIVLQAGYGFTAGWAGQHTGTIYGMFMGIPGLKVVVPSTAADAKGLMTAAIRDDNPVILFHNYLLTLEHGDVPEGEHVVPIGEAAVSREGSDVTIVGIGWTVGKALAAAEQLAGDGVSAEVIDARSLAPLDTGDDPPVGREDRPARRSGPGDSARLGGGDHRGGGGVRRLRGAQGARGARDGPGRDRSLQRADGAVPPAGRGEDRRRGAAGARVRARRGLDVSQSANGRLGGDVGLDLLRSMWRIRVFEERVGELTRADEVHGLVHLSVGQEAVAVGVCGQLRPDDVVYSGHRAHGHAIAKGAPLGRVMAELMGRDGGLCRGLGGSMHLVDVEHGFMGATGVVGGNVPLALGSALAGRLLGGDQVAVVFFGDGAVQGGIFVESVNLATLWALPVILVCENNGFAEFTPRSAHTNVERVSDVVAPYDVERETVDGNDVARCARPSPGSSPRRATERGPMLLECLTHRLRGHYEGDPQRYRQALAADEWQELDPILRLQRRGVAEGWLDADAPSRLEQEARDEVEAAVRVARESPFPPPDATAELVYAT